MRRARPERLSVLLAGCDEYTTLLIARHLPGAAVLMRPGRRRPHLAVVEAGDAAAVEMLGRVRPPAVVAIADRPDVRLPVPARIVTRPFLPRDLFDAIDDEMQRPARDRVRPTLTAAIRLALLALGAGVRGMGDGTAADLAFVAALVLYGVARLPATRFEQHARIADVVAACGLVAAAGGARSGFIPFAVLTVALAGQSLGGRGGAVAGGLVSVAAGTGVTVDAITDRASPTDALALLALFPLVGITGALVRRIRPADPEREMLTETNRLLTRLHGIAREIPGGMDGQTVATAVIEELRELGTPAAAVLAGDGTDLVVRASFGLGPIDGAAALLGSDTVRVALTDELSPPLRRALSGHPRWVIAQARRAGRVHGVIVAALVESGNEPAWRGALSRLATDAAVAFENAELLRRVGALAADEERRRIALRVHDGLAQTLTHLRLELDFVARHGKHPTGTREELARMSGVLDRAVDDVHGLMNDLRSEPAGERDVPPDQIEETEKEWMTA